MKSLLMFFVNQILGNAAIFFGLIALIGLWLQKKPISKIISGTTKTIIGFLILMMGATMLTSLTTPVAHWISILFNVNGNQPNMWAVLGISLQQYGTSVGLALLIGFFLNLLLARITPYRFVNVTGHIMMLWTAWEVAVLSGMGLKDLPLIISGGIISGLWFWLAPTLLYQTVKETMTDEWSLCMPNITGGLASYWGAKLIGNPENNLENFEVPEYLSWLQDSVVNIAIFSMILWIGLGVLVGPELVQQTAGDNHWIVFLILSGMRFSGGIAIILFGVRMLLAEIVPAFEGIADKLFPGALLGLDYPTIFQFSPTAVFVGFLAKLSGAITGTLLMVLFSLPVVIMPSIIMDFWDGALMGIIADQKGGRRAAVIMPFLLGILIQFGWMFMAPIVRGPIGDAKTLIDYPDAAFISPILERINNFLFQSHGSWAVVTLWILIFIIVVLTANIIGKGLSRKS